MYLTILDLGRQTVSVVYDEKDVTRDMTFEEEQNLLRRIGFRQEDLVMSMITEEDPLYQKVDEYITLDELLEDTE